MYVDIALSLNRTLQRPLLVVINSILSNTQHKVFSEGSISEPADLPPIRINVLVPVGDRKFFENCIQSAFAKDYDPESVVFRVREFTPPNFLKVYLDSKFKEKKADRRISRYMQYARFFLKESFPDIKRVIYLDGDTLVLGDIRALFSQGDQLTSQRYLAAVPQFFPAMFYFSNPFKIWADLRKFKSSFNSGVLLTDLSFWSSQTYRLLDHYLNLDAVNNYRLYHLGDETIFNLMFKESYIPLATRWNSCGYGQLHWIAALIRKAPEKISIIHWSGGHHKPWQSDRVIYSDIWRSYLPTAINEYENGRREQLRLVSPDSAVFYEK